MKSKSFLFAIRSQKLLLETFFPVCVTKFLWASAILFFFPQTEKVVIKDTTISKREIFFPAESDHWYLELYATYSTYEQNS